jgi:sporulation protein YlmC with PRC-barrel domain
MKKTLSLVAVVLTASLQPLLADDQKCAEAQYSSSSETKLMQLSKLMEAEATSRDGESLGEVKDMVIDVKTGKITHAIVGCGMASQSGEQMVPVPWRAITVQSEKQFTINVDKAKLARAPTMDSSFSSIADPAYVVTIERFYVVPIEIGSGETPAGEENGSGLGAGETPGGEESGSGSSSQEDTLKHESQSEHDHSEEK